MMRTSLNSVLKASIKPLYAPQSARSYATKKPKVDPFADHVELEMALRILRAYEVGYPNHTFELHVACRPEKGQHQIRGNFIMPHIVKTDSVLAVFAQGKQAVEAKEAGADIVGLHDIIEKIKNDDIKFDKVIATPDVLPEVAKVARILGPKGLMPTVNKGNVTTDITNAVTYAKKSFDYKADNRFVVHGGVAKVRFTDEEIKENISTLMSAIRAHGRTAKKSKKGFIQSIFISSTHGPGIPVLV